MGAFFLVSADHDDQFEDQLVQLFSLQGFSIHERLQLGQWAIHLYGKMNGISPSISFLGPWTAFCVGTFLYRSSAGTEALQLYLSDMSHARIDQNEVRGHFCLGIFDGNKLQLSIDAIGIYKVYHDRAKTIISSSFLAVLSSLTRATVNSQAVYEYIFQGTTYGGETIANEIECLKEKFPLVLDERTTGDFAFRRYKARIADHSFEENIEILADAIRGYAKALVASFNNHICCALSGGYDSRLLLAALLDQGITAKLVVYGKTYDPDVVVAKKIAENEAIPIEHIDKSSSKSLVPDAFPELIQKNFYAFDSFNYSGIFDNGADISTRMARVADGELYLNGGGGEILRNFFHLPDRKFTLREFLWSFYCQFDPRMCTDSFEKNRYLSELASKIRATINLQDNVLERESIEILYPAFRCRYWMGRNVGLDNRFGYALTPFGDSSIVEHALKVPLIQKSHGRLEARLIRKLSPELARYPSIYGHDFFGDPPLRRILSDWATLIRPPILRQYTFRIKNRRQQGRPYFLSDRYVDTVLDLSFPYMSRYFRVGKVRNEGQYNRLCTLEYLFQKYNLLER